MSSLADIIKRDLATYYEYDVENRVSRRPLILTVALLSVVAGAVVGVASNDFLAGALSAQAILVGFSFNVLFYLVANRLTAPSKWQNMEHELRFERLSTLSDEIFDNVTYFNLVAIMSAVGCLALLLIGSERFVANISNAIDWLGAVSHSDMTVARDLCRFGRSMLLSGLLFLLVESVITFTRTVGRVRFYFSMLKEMNDPTTA